MDLDDMSGMMFRTDPEKLKANPKRPSNWGEIKIAGVRIRIAGWVATGKVSGKKFLSIKCDYPDDEKRRLVSGDPEIQRTDTVNDPPITKDDLADLDPDDSMPF